MHATILLAAAALTTVASPALTPAPVSADDARCSKTIDQVRDMAGKSRLERGVAKPGEATAWLAVDRRHDDCRVLVPLRDPADIRPVPPPETGPARLIPGR